MADSQPGQPSRSILALRYDRSRSLAFADKAPTQNSTKRQPVLMRVQLFSLNTPVQMRVLGPVTLPIAPYGGRSH